jgi:hypothetical protein
MSDFFKFQSRREPQIQKSDSELVAKLLVTFDYITFNSDAEMVAVSRFDVPKYGCVTFSYYLRERHLLLVRGESTEKRDQLYNGYLHEAFPKASSLDDEYIPPQGEIMEFVYAKVLEAVQKALTPA